MLEVVIATVVEEVEAVAVPDNDDDEAINAAATREVRATGFAIVIPKVRDDVEPLLPVNPKEWDEEEA